MEFPNSRPVLSEAGLSLFNVSGAKNTLFHVCSKKSQVHDREMNIK